MTTRDRFWRQRPPRDLPVSAVIATLLNGWVQIACAILLFTTPFFWLFAMQADLPWLTFVGEKAWTEGEVIGIESTGASENGSIVYRVDYRYLVDRELEYDGKGYATGWTPAVGETIDVEYLVDDPERSRAEDLRGNMWSAWVLFVLIFPAIGAIGLWFTLRHSRRQVRLLRHGTFTTAKLEDRVPTNTTVNKRRVYACQFAYLSRSGRKLTGAHRTTHPEKVPDQDVPILYDPDQTSSMLWIESLRAKLRFDDEGRPRGRPFRALLCLILPTALVYANYIAFQMWAA